MDRKLKKRVQLKSGGSTVNAAGNYTNLPNVRRYSKE